ncbi:MAG: Mrp/NBP35 family ATP-binding protein [Alphaproteobacteria bacterium]|nr:Mrp/NBP35 family ATP-binding protein [Alphaproteobacteria bacterium]
MPPLTPEKVIAQLQSVVDPALGRVSGVSVEGGKVVFSIEIDPARGQELEPLRKKAQSAVEKMPGVTSALAILTAEKNAPPSSPAPSQPKQPLHKISQRPVAPQVMHIIAVASGKGGVGKSTVAANLAQAFVAMGKKTGLLDADIYGASQPRMMGIRRRPETDADDMIIPPTVHGMKVMSMGFFVEESAPVIWRGPMVHSAIQQLFRDVAWGELDMLVVDLPPGTGDAQLSLAQYVPLSGAVIVSTPQDVALAEAKKGLFMFQKVNVPVLGLIENMSYHLCANCGHREDIFDHGGVRLAAGALGVDFLGEIPLHADIRKAADSGTPLVALQKTHPVSELYKNIASRIWMNLPAEKTVPKAPR